MTSRTWFSRLALVGLLAVGAAAAACGDSGSDDAESTDGDSATAGDGASAGSWPVEIDHASGTTTIEARPERIVSLNVQWTDVLLSLDVVPAGYLIDRTSGEETIYPWQEGRLDDSTEIVMTDALPLERIAALDPDLILVTYTPDEATFDNLAEIAPTIGQLGTRQVDPWQDMAEVAGQFLGEPDRAAEVVAEAEALVADTAAQLPALQARTFSLVNYLPDDSLWVVADPEDGSSVFFQQLGMELDPDLVDQAQGESGRIQLSLEQVDLLDSDLLVVLPNDGDPNELPGYGELPAVTSGAVAELEFEDVVGLNTPTPLSIPYALDLILPALEAVGG